MLPIENSLNEFPCALLVTLDILDHDCMPCSGDLASSCLLPHSPPRTAKPRSHERTSASSLASPQLPPFAVPSPANTHERTSAPAAPPTSACRLSHPPVRRSCEYDRSSMSSPPGPRTFHPRLSSTFPPPRPPIRNSSPGQTLLILGPNIDETDFTPYSDFTPPPSVFMTVDSWGSTEMQYLGDPDVRRHALGRSRLSSTQNSNHVDPLDSLLELSSSNRSDRSRLPSHGRLEGCSVTASSTRSSQYRGTWHRIMTLNAAREMANREEKRKASGSSGHSFRSSPSRSPLPRSPPPRSPPSRSPNPQKPDPSNLKGVLGMSVASCQGQYRWSSVCQQLNQMTAARRISKPNKVGGSAGADAKDAAGVDAKGAAGADAKFVAGADANVVASADAKVVAGADANGSYRPHPEIRTPVTTQPKPILGVIVKDQIVLPQISSKVLPLISVQKCCLRSVQTYWFRSVQKCCLRSLQTCWPRSVHNLESLGAYGAGYRILAQHFLFC